MSNIVAIVGRPNVGKSTLFNRFLERREAIVDSTAGVTRDRHYGKSDWNGVEFTVIDTGLYHIHAFVYNPFTWSISSVQLGVTTGYDLNLTLTQAGGPICASLDVLGASFQVNACPPACTAGSDASISLCSNTMPLTLLNVLGGDPCPDGMWTAPNGNSFSGIFNPATDAPGAYTYTVGGSFNAPYTATVFVNVVMDSIIDLRVALGTTSDPSGTWANGGAPFNGQFDPSTMGSGTYIYTVLGTSPCTNATASVTIVVNTPPDAGTDGEVTACIDGPAVLLFPALNGTPDMGGSWTGPSEVDNGVFVPGAMDAGTYTYMVLGDPPCPSESAVVMVYLLECPNELAPNLNENANDAATAVSELPAGQPIGIWPNPATDAVKVVLPFPAAEISRLELIDATGRIVRAVTTAPSANELTLDVSTLTPGLWTLRVTAVDGVSVGRFVRSTR